MSKRAEKMALTAHPDKVFRYKKIGDADGVMTGESVDSQQYIRDYFIEGYEQAEKDFALTWEDVAKIITIYEAGIDNGDYLRYNEAKWMKEYSQDILRKFNEQRNKCSTHD